MAQDKQKMEIAHLEQAQRHIAQGNRHIAEQESRVADLARKGHDVTEAERLLNLFLETQAQHLAHRDLILQELDQPGDT